MIPYNLSVESPFILVSEASYRFGLIEPHDRIIVGFSGGPDSVFLVHALRDLFPETELHLAHLDHGLREGSSEDAEFCRNFAGALGLKITVEKADVKTLAKDLGLGLEEAGRLARYELFRKLKSRLGFNKIATGHTLSDWLETYLMNLFRGAGLRGMKGLSPKDGDIIRPLILVEKDAILEYLRAKGIPFREDETNLDTRFRRNWIRHELLPIVKERLPWAPDALRRHMIALNEAWDHVRTEAIFLAERTRRPSPRGQYIFNRDALLDYNSFLFKMMVLEIVPGLTAAHLNEVVAILEKGGEVHLPGGWKAQASEGDIRFFKDDPAAWRGEILVERDGFYPVPELNLELEVIRGKAGDGPFSETFPEALLPFVFRTRRPGDRWGKKPLKDKMIGLRIPSWRRDRIPLVAKGNQVLWIPGFAKWRMRGREELTLRIRRLSDEFWVYDF